MSNFECVLDGYSIKVLDAYDEHQAASNYIEYLSDKSGEPVGDSELIAVRRKGDKDWKFLIGEIRCSPDYFANNTKEKPSKNFIKYLEGLKNDN